jgi:hypothetical protein
MANVRFGSEADIGARPINVRFVPKADITSGLIDYFISAAEQRRRHGEAEHSGGLRIDDQIELVRFDNWQLRGLGALKDAANVLTSLTKCIDNVGSVAYQASDLDKVSQRIDGRESIKRCQLSQLDAPTVQKHGGADNDCIGGIATHCLEGRIDLGTRVRIVNLDLQSHCASGSVYVRQLSFSGTRIGWINDYAYPRSVGQQITKHLQPLCYYLGSERLYSGQVATWSRETRSQAKLHWITRYEDYGYGRRCRLGSQRRWRTCSDYRRY